MIDKKQIDYNSLSEEGKKLIDKLIKFSEENRAKLQKEREERFLQMKKEEKKR